MQLLASFRNEFTDKTRTTILNFLCNSFESGAPVLSCSIELQIKLLRRLVTGVPDGFENEIRCFVDRSQKIHRYCPVAPLPPPRPYPTIPKSARFAPFPPLPKPKSQSSQHLIPVEFIERRILLIPRRKVMLDHDPTPQRAGSPQPRPFPGRLRLCTFAGRVRKLESHIATSSSGLVGRRKRPRSFTEHDAVMAANVLNSPVAVRARIRLCARSSGSGKLW